MDVCSSMTVITISFMFVVLAPPPSYPYFICELEMANSMMSAAVAMASTGKQ